MGNENEFEKYRGYFEKTFKNLEPVSMPIHFGEARDRDEVVIDHLISRKTEQIFREFGTISTPIHYGEARDRKQVKADYLRSLESYGSVSGNIVDVPIHRGNC